VNKDGGRAVARLLFALWFGEPQPLERDAGDVGGVLLRGVGVQVVEAALVAAADHVEDSPGEGVEGLRLDLAGLDGFFEDGDEAVVAGAEGFVGLAAVLLFAANGDDQAVEVLLVRPELEAGSDDQGELLAQAVGGGEAFGDEGVELVDGLAEGGGVDVFLGAEVEVQCAFGDLRGGGDVVDGSVGETLLSKDLDSGGEDLAAAQVGEGLLTSLGGSHGIHASTWGWRFAGGEKALTQSLGEGAEFRKGCVQG
jgi:hypothetical protein